MVRDENCERLKISKTLYDMGMKVAAVFLCQDRRVYDAMEMQEHLVQDLERLGNKQQMSGSQTREYHHQK